MDWLLQNGLWVVFAMGVLAYLLYRKRMHEGGSFTSMFGGESPGVAAGDHHDHGRIADTGGPPTHPIAEAAIPDAAIDPVSGTAVQISAALTSVFAGRIYYFVSADNRARFEAAPRQFVRDEEGRGLPAQNGAPATRPHHRHGC